VAEPQPIARSRLHALMYAVCTENLIRVDDVMESGSMSRSRVSPNTWSNGASRPARDGTPFCVTMRQILPPWTCSLSRPLASTCCAYIIVRLDRRELFWINITSHLTAEWVARQIIEAFPWDEAPRYMVRDWDRTYGALVTRRSRDGIRDRPIAPASSWQNGFAERLIGSIRRECSDRIIVRDEVHLRRVLRSYADYYNGIRTHWSLDNDAGLSSGSTDRMH
jgi:Integrase core domain